MNSLTTQVSDEKFYRLLLKPRDGYDSDAKYFVKFLRKNSYGVTIEGLRAYAEYLKSEIGGRRYSASTYNKRLQGAKNRLMYLFTNTPDSFSVLKRYKFEEALKAVKPQKINSVAVSDENILSGEEVEKIILESEDNTVSIMIEFLYVTGLRISEMLNILLSDISRNNGKCIIKVLGKRMKERKIYVSTPLINKVKNQFGGNSYLFEHHGSRYNRISITNRIAIQGRIILDKKISAHTFRHSFATATLEKTGNLKGVSKYLGHSSTSTTANLYIHSELSWDDIAT